MLFTIFLYIFSIALTIILWKKDPNKTKKSLFKALKSFENILPQFISVLFLIGLIFSIIPTNTISKILGNNTGIIGIISAGIIGSLTLIPSFIAFPLVASFKEQGAGVPQIVMFISTLMMVGLVTIPIEKEYFGKKITYSRNILSFIFSLIIAIIMGGVLVW
ncbi:MAG: permease [Fusobacteriaceae bacterium]